MTGKTDKVTSQFLWWSYLRKSNPDGSVAYSWQVGNEKIAAAIACAMLTADAVCELDAACAFLFAEDNVSNGGRTYRRDLLRLDVQRPRLVQRTVACVIALATIEVARASARMFPCGDRQTA